MITDPMWLLGEDDLATALKSSILHAARNAPRSLQTAIGPSEVGQSCLRRLAHKVAGTPVANDGGDPWRPTVGTAAHAWLAEALGRANADLGAGARYLVEEGVQITDWLSGSCDGFDRQTGTAFDWKVVGPTSLKKYRKDGPSAQYRTQVHIYGKGLALAGHDVRRVSIVFLPSAGTLGDTHIWTEDYDQAVADDAIARLEQVRTAVAAGVRPSAFPATPESDRLCLWCPFYAYGTTDLDAGCPGVDKESTWVASTTAAPAA